MTDRPDQSFDAAGTARRILTQTGTAALASLGDAGAPFASFVTVAPDAAGCPLLLLSQLAVHTRNVERDGRASLLLVAPGGEGGDPLAGARLTLEGHIVKLPKDSEEAADARASFLARHPEAEGYAGFSDFSFYRLDISGGHLVAGFGRIVSLSPEDLRTDRA
ncbi:heme utilization protein HutZ [Hartmannibacter diazotrophicus]|uniref:Heme utilization protein HutZ n=1 Tax=Hartmannibacter diazotrophicus TaxID=1482074 RepID=A0A2C9DDK9_9HYPH|nr:pyridoxamine 5'-phosphate oxidase family protein [Hartmannibacter diazotrophicus]SON58387.1 heme utilization protein HutZ [Hartmannibacter diazotrophicus]